MTVSHCFVTLGGMDLPVEHFKSGTFLDLVIDIVLGRAEVVGRIVVKRWMDLFHLCVVPAEETFIFCEVQRDYDIIPGFPLSFHGAHHSDGLPPWFLDPPSAFSRSRVARFFARRLDVLKIFLEGSVPFFLHLCQLESFKGLDRGTDVDAVCQVNGSAERFPGEVFGAFKGSWSGG